MGQRFTDWGRWVHRNEVQEMKESQVEKSICAFAKAIGWKTLKLNGHGDRGKPDRMFLKNGKVVFIEVKRKGKQARKQQAYRLQKLRENGFKAQYVDSLPSGVLFIKNCDREFFGE